MGLPPPRVPRTYRCEPPKIVAVAPRRTAPGPVQLRLLPILALTLGVARKLAAIASKTVAEWCPTPVRPVSSIVSAFDHKMVARQGAHSVSLAELFVVA